MLRNSSRLAPRHPPHQEPARRGLRPGQRALQRPPGVLRPGRRRRDIHAKVRSATRRRHGTVKPPVSPGRCTISMTGPRPCSASAAPGFGPAQPPSAQGFRTSGAFPASPGPPPAPRPGPARPPPQHAHRDREPLDARRQVPLAPLAFLPASQPDGPPASVVSPAGCRSRPPSARGNAPPARGRRQRPLRFSALRKKKGGSGAGGSGQ